MSSVFTRHRSELVMSYSNGNPKVTSFVGTGIDKWKTSSVTKMSNMFRGAAMAATMTVDLGGWDVAKVTDMSQTFWETNILGNGLDSWKTGSVTNMAGTFSKAVEMNGDLTAWDVSQVVTMEKMFDGAAKFEGKGLNTWSVAKVTDMSSTFRGATFLTSCNKRKIADAWNGNPNILTWATSWAKETCTKVRV